MKNVPFAAVAVLVFLAESFAQEHPGANVFGRKTSIQTTASSPFSAPLLVDETTPYPTPALAIQALNLVAETKYRELTGDRTSDLAALGAKAQELAELSGFIVERLDQDGNPVFYATELQKLPAQGGKSRGVRTQQGDKVYGYHTGQHTAKGVDGKPVITILSNTDFKGLLSSAKEAEFAYDMAANTVVGMDRKGNLFQLTDSGDWVDMSGRKSDFCQSGISRYEKTESFLQSSETVNSGPACVSDSWGASLSVSPESAGASVLAEANAAIPADMAAMAGQLANQVGSIQSRQHACTSFEFVKDYLDARKQPYQKLYRCTECGKETIVDARGGETIEDKIAQNKQRAALTGQAYGFAQGALQAMPGAMAAQNGAGCATPDAGVADILNEHGLMAGSALLCTMTERGEGPLAHYNTQPTQENP